MIFLFEEFSYSESFLKSALGDAFEGVFNIKDGVIKGVGYCFGKDAPVFVLPKVFVQEIKKDEDYRAFGEKIDKDGKDVFGNQILDTEGQPIFNEECRHFLSNLGLWLYSAIEKYRTTIDRKDDGVRYPQNSESARFKKSDRHATWLDIMSSMELFYKKNQNLFVFVAKNKNSGNHKIDWRKTINKKNPFLQDGFPVYVDLVRRAKVFDLDDRLLVLYFSAMNYLHEEFGYDMPRSEFYEPLRKNEIDRFLDDERGLRELRRIKYKYFADKFVQLFNIVEAFFRWGANYKKKTQRSKEYLVANSFNNVFEAMIDELIGDRESNVEKLKHNKDGKIIDHLYKERSLVFSNIGDVENQIWHIGDSKYYKDENELDTKSIAKQFTYAKNLIQDFFSPNYFESGSAKLVHKNIHYRDSLTEGYSITPNFFIRGHMPYPMKDDGSVDIGKEFSFKDADGFLRQNTVDERKYNDPLIVYDKAVNGDNSVIDSDNPKGTKRSLWDIRNRHFENRLFDRDTLLLQVYNVNFLYVLKAYTSPGSALREDFKSTARKEFRSHFLNLLNSKYRFYKIVPQNCSVKDFVDRHFREWIGRMFCPEMNVDDDKKTFLIYAEEQGDLSSKSVDPVKGRRFLGKDEYIQFPIMSQDFLLDDFEKNANALIIRQDSLDDRIIEEKGVLELSVAEWQDLCTDRMKYLVALEEQRTRLFFVIGEGFESLNDRVWLPILEHRGQIPFTFDRTKIDDLTLQVKPWKDLCSR